MQIDLLSEVRTPQQVLNFAIKRERERGQAYRQEILKAHTSNTNRSNVSYIRKTHVTQNNKDNSNNQYYQHQHQAK